MTGLGRTWNIIHGRMEKKASFQLLIHIKLLWDEQLKQSSFTTYVNTAYGIVYFIHIVGHRISFLVTFSLQV